MLYRSFFQGTDCGVKEAADGLRSPFASRKQALHLALTEPLFPLNIIATSMRPRDSCCACPLGNSHREKHLKTGLSNRLAEHEAANSHHRANSVGNSKWALKIYIK